MRKILFVCAIAITLNIVPAMAMNMSGNTAVLGALDKITGRVSSIEVPVGEKVKFLALDISVQACFYKPPEEAPDNIIFLNISEKILPKDSDDEEDAEIKQHFNGWMYSSSPAVSALEHPVYDIWSIECKNVIVEEEEEAPETKQDSIIKKEPTKPEVKTVSQ